MSSDRLTQAESRIVRLAQAILPIERDLEVLKTETKALGLFRSRVEGQLDVIKWLIVTVPTLMTIATAIVTYIITHKAP